MANDAHTQQALAADTHFHSRVRAALAKVAWEVIEEPDTTPHHDERVAYARNIALPNLANVAVQISPWLVERTNLFAFATSYDFAASSVVTAAGDADIESQLMTDWNVLAGV
jgi:hypothetical protein